MPHVQAHGLSHMHPWIHTCFLPCACVCLPLPAPDFWQAAPSALAPQTAGTTSPICRLHPFSLPCFLACQETCPLSTYSVLQPPNFLHQCFSMKQIPCWSLVPSGRAGRTKRCGDWTARCAKACYVPPLTNTTVAQLDTPGSSRTTHLEHKTSLLFLPWLTANCIAYWWYEHNSKKSQRGVTNMLISIFLLFSKFVYL